MVRAVGVVSLDHELGDVQSLSQLDGICFTWSHHKIRIASLVLCAIAVPVSIGFLVVGPIVQWLCLGCLAAVGLLAHTLSQRAAARSVVLSIDSEGILDRRLMPRRIAWQEIETICPVDVSRSHVVDIKLRRPEATLAGTRWPVRIGAVCQNAYGVPAVTVSMLLLDGTVAEVIDGVARWRPDLLDRSTGQSLHDG